MRQLLFLCPCSNLTVYRQSFFAQPLCASLSCLQYSISFGNKKPDDVDRYYIVFLSNLIEEVTELLKVESVQAVLGATSPAVEPHLRP